MKAVKKLVNRGMEGSLETGLELEMLAMTAHGTTEDFAEGDKVVSGRQAAAIPGKIVSKLWTLTSPLHCDNFQLQRQ